jgi:hypothetical protein
MKVFLSWSGSKSHEVAKLLSEWLASVIQSCKPWISSRDIDRGSLWFTEISDQLQNTQIGIICLTQANKEKPWILFEAGALAKGLSSSRVCTFLIDLQANDVKDPLAQLNHTFCKNKDSVRGLIQTLNTNLGEHRLENLIIENVFETYWPQFEAKLNEILNKYPVHEVHETGKNDKNSVPNMLSELMDLSRANASRLRRVEQELEPKRIRDRLPRGARIELIESEIKDMIRGGMPRSLILERFSDEIPRQLISQLIDNLKVDD